MALRWPHSVHLLGIGAVSFAAATVGVVARRRRCSHWVFVHGTAMAASYTGLWTGFLVDNGPLLPVWRELPHQMHWAVPTIVGLPLLLLALARRVPGKEGQTGSIGTSQVGLPRTAGRLRRDL